MQAVHYGLALAWGILILSHCIAWFCIPKNRALRAEIITRIKTWWVIIIVVSIALIAPWPLPQIIFALISFVAFKEFISLQPSRMQDRWAFIWAYISIPVQYYWVATDWFNMFLIFIPTYIFLLLPARMVFSGHPQGFLRSTSTLYWGLMTTVFIISHMAQMLMWPAKEMGATVYQSNSLLFFLVFMTQINDIAQFVWGKSFGKRKILPLVSPGKTWAGFLGGVATTVVLTALLAHYFTPFTLPQAIFAGFIFGVAGFVGDVVMSAVKRDVGVKDTGTILPGHGGILDRLDSLIFTTPLYFHFLRYLYY